MNASLRGVKLWRRCREKPGWLLFWSADSNGSGGERLAMLLVTGILVWSLEKQEVPSRI